MQSQRHRVVIVGGGFGGLNAARTLADADAEVTIVDRTNHHLFQPLLYQVAAGILPAGLIAPALRNIVRKQRNTRVVLADVHHLDLDQKVVHAAQPDGAPLDLAYDTLVVAAGATHSYFGNDYFARFAPGMKTIEDARYLRDGVLSKFEMAELATNAQDRAEWLTFVVIGAGPTGVELVGQIAELAHQVLPRRTLEQMGVEVRVNTLAVDMDHDSITVKGPDGIETIRARTRIWAAGVQASPLAGLLADRTGADTDRPGRVVVNPDCTLPGHPEVFAIGDMANVNKLPGVAQPAIQEGKYVGNLIRARLAGQADVKPFKYFDKGSMATIGHKSAVAQAFGRRFTGLTAYGLWSFIHVMYLVGWGNRLGTMYTWGRALYFAKNRGHRIISFEQAHNRVGEGLHHSGRPAAILPAGGRTQPGSAPASRPVPQGKDQPQ
jgi:NADH dehydrogenase